MRKQPPQRPGRQAGLSLIETTLLLLIVSLLLLPLLKLIEIRRTAHRYDQTQGNLTTVASALHQHVQRNGRYPRPAARHLAEGDADFGRETSLALGDLPFCAGGGETLPCSTIRMRPGGPPALILIGDVPFAALGLESAAAVDGWGGKLTYAVTADLTEAAFFDDNGGGIRIVDADGDDHEGANGNAHFALVSHGVNQRGAFSIAGRLIAPCVTGAEARADVENCNNDGAFNSNFAEQVTEIGVAYNRQHAVAESPAYYDDFLRFSLSAPGDIWGRSRVSSLSPDVFKRNRGRVRIGAPPNGSLRLPIAMVEVMGHAATDRLLTPRICPYPTNRAAPRTGCAAVAASAGAGLVSPRYLPGVFTPSIIGGVVNPANAGRTGGGIDCGRRGVTGISAANEECALQEVANVGLLSGLQTLCTPDPRTGISRYPRGVNADGTLICERP